MIIKSIVIIVFVLIIVSLGLALFHLVSHKTPEVSEKTVNALTFRIALSLLLFIFIFIALAAGIIKPHGIGARLHSQKPSETPRDQSAQP